MNRLTGRLAARLSDPGVLVGLPLAALLFGFAVSVDVPRVAFGFQGDTSTYYSLALSLARDRDFVFERRDLARVWEEFPSGPEGIFLKRGKRLDIERTASFPFLGIEKHEDPRHDRLYYGKSFVYPLFVAPFVAACGTNGFLVFHALLMVGNFAVAYVFLRARSSAVTASAFAFAFFFASAAPVYFAWLTPELFNLSVMLYGLFAWAYKEVAEPLNEGRRPGRVGRWLRSPASDVAAAVLLGVATFSKPTNVFAMVPLGLLFLVRRQWLRGFLTGVAFAATTAGLFGMNAAITGEFNYQGGDRKTFYGSTGFPFQRSDATFERTGAPRATDAVPVDVLVNEDALTDVLPRNVFYFLLGRHTGLVPYFFPGILLGVLFLFARGQRRPFQWCVLAGLGAASIALITYMPFTYSGGGGPVGNRYFMGYYALFLFLAPPLASPVSAMVAMTVGALFTAQLVLNPFYTSFYPSQHPKHGPLRLLPVELSLLNDLPLNVTPSRAKQPLAGDPPLTAYFLDDNAYQREGEWFWIKGRSRAEMLLRAPARRHPDGRWEPLRLEQVRVELETGAASNQVVADGGAGEVRVDMPAHASATLAVDMAGALPYRPTVQPTNYVYHFSIGVTDGFVPMFVSDSLDHRFLGVMVRIVPVYE